MAMRIKNAMKATPPTTLPAMAPGLIWLEADSVVVCGCATIDDDDDDVGDVPVVEDDDIVPVEDEIALDDVDLELVFNVVLALAEDKNGAAT